MTACPSCSAEQSDASKFCSECGAALASGYAATEVHAAAPRSTAGSSRSTAESSQSSLSSGSHHGRFLPGTKVADRYRIVSLVGKGGMGEVYRADDLKLGHTVALKFLPRELAENPQRLDYFHSEVRLTRQISHPNVCRVYDIGEVDGQHFLSMEYIDGEDLKVLLRRIGRLPRDKGVQIAQQLCAGLSAAHDKGVLHRDLKPANIMIDGRGHVRITDFGLARIAGDEADGEVAGTPAYMAPEQLARGQTTVQSDLYSLGLILYELFTGKALHQGESIPELIRAHEQSSTSKPSSLVDDMDAAVERAILRCLEKEPHARPKSALAVGAALPGGDPLAAALAAGETPSPEMIAAAGQTGSLPLAVGGGLFAAVCLLLIALPFVESWLDKVQLRPLADNKPDVLEGNARDWTGALSASTSTDSRTEQAAPWTEKPSDRVFGFQKTRGNDEDRRVAKLLFWYRQNSTALNPQPTNLMGSPIEQWSVSLVSPPPILPGMVTARLDAAAPFNSGEQLLEFLAVPPPDALNDSSLADSSTEAPAPVPKELLARAGLNPDDFQDVPESELPRDWRPPIDADSVAVWQHKTATPLVQVVMATRGDRIVYFRRITGKSASLMGMMTQAESNRFTSFWPALSILMVLFAGVLALHNLRTGRSDTRGALRLALYFFAVNVAMWTVAGHHVLEPYREIGLGVNYLFRALAHSLRLWLGYVALEPYVRRLWPEVLISWSRVLAGRLRDPRVGRDLLIGCLFAVAITIPVRVVGDAGYHVDPDSIGGGRFLLGSILEKHQGNLGFGIFNLALLLLYRMVLRSTWLAGLLHAVILTAVVSLGVGAPVEAPNTWLLNAVWAGVWVVIYFRFGLLCAIAGQTMLMILLVVPHTADFGQWYAQAGLLALAAVLVVAAYGFYTSTLAGRPLLAALDAGAR